MTKRDCEAWFNAVVETLSAPGATITHARLLATTARDLLAEEREQRNRPVIFVGQDDLDAHDDEVEGRLLLRLERNSLLVGSAEEASQLLNG